MLDLLFPRRCLLCGRLGSQLCGACRARLPRIRPPLCARCGAPSAWPVERCRECAGRRLAFFSARAALLYEERTRALVRAWKDGGLRALAAVGAELVAETVPRPCVDALTFVPADADRRLRRGHHPAERLASELGSRWGLPVLDLLVRTRPLRPQRGLSLGERRGNVRGSVTARRPSPRAVALVDDVYTSGSTADEAARALSRRGARVVEVVTLARAVR